MYQVAWNLLSSEPFFTLIKRDLYLPISSPKPMWGYIGGWLGLGEG